MANKGAKAPTIRANVLATIVAEVARQGGDVDALLRLYIEGGDIRNPYQEIPLARYVEFFEAASEMVGDPFLGARLGSRFQPEEFGPIGIVFVAASNLQAALNRLGFFLQAWQSGTSAELELGHDTADWTYQIDDPAIHPRRQDAEFSLAANCCFIRAMLGASWAPLEVHFEHSAPTIAPRERNPLSGIFRAPIVFDQGVNRLVIDRQDLRRTVVNNQPVIAPYLEQHLRDLLVARGDDDSFAPQVSYLIARRMGRQPLSVGALAHELGVSSRTFQRRLSEEGTSLRQLIRAHRNRVAEPLLKESGALITSIAHTVGYADPTVFSRAFKAWRGESPRTFRQTKTDEDKGR